MRNCHFLTATPAALIIGTIVFASTSFAQEVAEVDVTAVATPQLFVSPNATGSAAVAWDWHQAAAATNSRSEIDQLRRKLRDAKTDEARSEITDQLHDALNAFFEKDLEARKKSLDALRTRITEMEDLLEKRQAAKDEIIDLQMQMFAKEAEGMGFFGAPAEANFLFQTRSTGAEAPRPPHVVVPLR